ncbi:MAG: ankyrin repeat domain-containing protein [Firmicutes bacterium]|nr:ankyrin repeat domain-containing protein [Bacillota bacterium]
MRTSYKKLFRFYNEDKLNDFLASNDINSTDSYGNTLMHVAVYNENLKFVIYLLSQYPDLSITNHKWLNPIEIASMINNPVILENLIRQEPSKNNDALACASSYGLLENVKILLSNGYDINRFDCRGRTSLHLATQENKLEVVKYLCESGALMDICDSDGFTPLIHASAEYSDIVKYLISKEANPDLHTDCPAIVLATAWDNFQSVKHLVEAGANINLRDNDGRTALFYAVIRENKVIKSYLLKNGASVDLIDDEGYLISDLIDNKEAREKLYFELYEEDFK